MPLRRAAALALTGGLVAAACSGESGPPVFEAADLVDVTAVSASPGARWGTGYAVAARPMPDGRTAVVTTAGVFVDDGSGDGSGEPTEVDVFGGPTQVHLTALSSDGSTLVVGTSSPTTLRWYDLADGSPVTVVDLGIDLAVQELAFLGDSTTLIALTSVGVVSWDAASPTAAPTVLHGAPVGSITIDGGRAISPALDAAELVVIDGATAERRPIEVPADARLQTAQAAPGGALVAVNAGVGPNEFERLDTIVVLDASTFAPVGTIALDRPIQPLEWALADDVVATAFGPTLSVLSFDGETLAEATPLPDDPIQSIVATASGVATIHRSGAAIAWNAPDWSPVTLGEGGVTLRFAVADGDVVSAVDFDGRIAHWNVTNGSRTELDAFADGEATAIAVDDDAGRVAVATAAGRTILLDAGLSPQAALTIAGRSPRVDTVEFHPTDAVIVTGLAERLGELAFDDSVTLWDRDTLEPGVTIGGESEDVAGCSFYYNRVGFTPDGTLMSTVSHDYSVEIHDGFTGDYIVTLPPFSSTVLDTDFSVTGEVLVASADDASVRVWETEDFTELASYRGPPGGLQALEMLPDDLSMVATDLTGRLLLIDFLTGEELSVFAELGSRTSALGLSHDGGIVAAPMPDGTIGLWSTTSGALLTTLTGHASTVTDIEFAPDDRSVYSSSRDGTVRQWELDVAIG